jgi:hypothetical protein
LARYDAVPVGALAGQSIVIPSDAHGLALLKPIRELLIAARAEVVLPPDATSAGTERYGLKHGLPVITFGWFRQGRESRKGTVSRPIAGFDLSTDFVLLARDGELSHAALNFIAYARGRHDESALQDWPEERTKQVRSGL